MVVKVDVRDQGHSHLCQDGGQRFGRGFIGAGHADDVRPCLLQSMNLGQCCGHIIGRRIGHGLHADRRIAADRNGANLDSAGAPALNLAPGADGRHGGPRWNFVHQI